MSTKVQAVKIRPYSENPFRGPAPLRQGDPIFGRDREIRSLLSQLLADRLVLLHSPSGCGKTSLVEAGLRPKLRQDFVQYPRIVVKRTEEESASVYTMLAKIASSVAPDMPPSQGQPGDDARIVAYLRSRLANRSIDFSTNPLEHPADQFSFLFVDQFEESLA